VYTVFISGPEDNRKGDAIAWKRNLLVKLLTAPEPGLPTVRTQVRRDVRDIVNIHVLRNVVFSRIAVQLWSFVVADARANGRNEGRILDKGGEQHGEQTLRLSTGYQQNYPCALKAVFKFLFDHVQGRGCSRTVI
jgi:hypothetical protein